MIEINSLRPIAIAAIALGVSFAIATNYVVAGVWVCFGITILLIEKVGIDSMTRLLQPEVIFTWMFFLAFISLSIYQVVKDFVRT
ncbi:hypothetical protein [Pseudanabaena sp. PCC 6802]|uniref:hypothetical protein n=1 Tax=Pseudanabaena sp. PCC 6802 TaxID=118173 RepID=UPI0003476B57|nr:hypothetical protein [Pseudanabaena sp. PCC 6802]